MVPGVSHAKAVRAEEIDVALLSHRPNLPGVVDWNLFRQDDDLLDVLVDAHQLVGAIAHGRRRQMDHAHIEVVSVVEAIAHVVVDRNGPIGVSRTSPRRPGDVPNTMLPRK